MSTSRPFTVYEVFFRPDGSVRPGWRAALWVAGVIVLFSMLWMLVMAGGVRPTFTAQAGVELAAGLGAGWALLALVDRKPLGALGYALDRAAPRDAAIGFGLGGGAIALAAGVLAVAGSARWVADAGTAPEYVAALGQALLFFVLPAAAEETLFRGYGFQALVQGIGAWPAVLLSSAGFALAHAWNPNVTPFALVNIGVAGVMLAWAYLRTRSLWFVTALHMGWNWTMAALLDLPVSGMVSSTPLYTAIPGRPEWLSGGSFGPEGGVAVTVILVVLTLVLLRAPWVRESGAMRALRPLVDDRLNPREEAP